MKNINAKKLLSVSLCVSALLLSSCSKETPRTTAEFLENPRLLEATMVRCAANRAEMKYTEECVNAREAVDRLAVRDEEANRSQLEAESIRKREALRRARQAAEEAQLRAEELERLRREAEYLGQFDEVPAAGSNESYNDSYESNEPVNESLGNEPGVGPAAVDNPAPPASDNNAATALPEADATLDEVREELRRRQESPPG